jgi:UDP-3-O-[3-hydroxymyristoyl] N-acetylglucosamine deacetylase
MCSASGKVILEEVKRCLGLSSAVQKTISFSVTLKGKGLHAGNVSSLTFSPAPQGTGVLFRRVDLNPVVEIPAHVDFVKETMRSTDLGAKGAVIKTVEHLLSAVYVLGITNLYIDISGDEIPILDGSSLPFFQALENAQVVSQNLSTPVYQLPHPVYYSSGETCLVALPSENFRISYTLDYPNHSWIGSQYYSYNVELETYSREIAPCRTFCLYEELTALTVKGLIKGGSLDCAVVIKEDGIVNKDGLHFENEMVRHKILDLIGDLSLVGKLFSAHVIAIRSGHCSNVAFAKEILNTLKMENS